jgi:hypothetical protein
MVTLLAEKIATSFGHNLGCLLNDFDRAARKKLIRQVYPGTKKALATSRRAAKQSQRAARPDRRCRQGT